MAKPPPSDLMDWPKSELAKEVARLRAITREIAERPGTDPTQGQAPDAMVDIVAGPAARGGALLDARSAVLLDHINVVLLQGRVNYSTERVDHAYLFGPDGAAALVSELIGLAGRAAGADGHGERFADEFRTLLEERMEQLP
jgi:hypothetical protein